MKVLSQAMTLALSVGLALITNIAQAQVKPILDRQVVVLKKGVDPEQFVQEYQIHVSRFFHHVLLGFSARIPDQTLDQLSRDPRVQLIQKDQSFQTRGVESQNDGSSWGLDRIDQRSSMLDSEYRTHATGAGVTVYVIDTGVLATHSEFQTEKGSRVISEIDLSDPLEFEALHPFCPDAHGTHVAGIVGGNTYGVAKEIQMVSVRVLNCRGEGSTSAIVAGIEWVAKNHRKPAVANLSLGGPIDRAIDLAVQNLVASGVITVTAAGNTRYNACISSPGHLPNVINVAASDRDDSRWFWGDYGRCVDLFAPGVDILSAWRYPTSDTTTTLSGSSMSTAFVSGAAALYLERHPTASPIEVRNALLQQSTKNVITDARSKNAHLLYIHEETQPSKKDVLAPIQVQLVAPQAGQTLIANETFEFKAQAIDNGTIKKVQFFVDGILRGVSKQVPFVASIQIGGRKKIRTVWAVAYDRFGNVTASNPVKININY